jgi:hypothetical protein
LVASHAPLNTTDGLHAKFCLSATMIRSDM